MIHIIHRARRVASIAVLAIACGAGCANPEEGEAKPDASVPAVDGGATPDAGIANSHVLEQSNLAPATEAAAAGPYRIRGHLRSSEVRPATNSTHQVRGGFVPLTR